MRAKTLSSKGNAGAGGTFGTALIVGLLGAGVALAQDAESPVGETQQASREVRVGLEEVMVTARRREESMMDVPIAITALTTEELEVRGLEDRRDLNRFTPGFKYQPQNTSSASRLINSYSMRGLGSVTMFWNGVPMNGGDVPEMLDLSRVEVLRGPQNAHFGRSTFSGAINFIPTAADFDFGGYLKAGIGNHDMKNVEAAVQGTIVPGLLAGRVAVDYHELGGQYDNYGWGGDRLGRQETLGGTASLLFTPTEALELRLSYTDWEVDDGANAITYFQVDDYWCNAGAAPPGTNNFFCGEISRPRADRISQMVDFPDDAMAALRQMATRTTTGPDYCDDKENGLCRDGSITQLTASYDLPMGFTASAMLSKYKNKAWHNFDYGSRYYTDPNTYNPSLTTYVFDDDYIEFRIESDQSRRFRGMIGYSDYDASQIIESVLNRSGQLSISFAPTTNWSETKGVFASLSYDMFDGFTATVEGRYQEDLIGRDRLDFDTYSATTYSFVPRVILQYHFNENVNGFVSYAEGSSPGSLNFGFLQLPAYAQEQILAQTSVPLVLPEAKLENYEIGFKGSFFDNRLRLTGAVYYGVWKGRGSSSASLFYTTPQGVLTQANIAQGGRGEAEGMGTEWEALWAPVTGLTIAGTLAFNKTEVDDSVCGACVQTTGNGNVTGNYLPRFPGRSASLAVSYEHPAFSNYDAFYRIDANYNGKEYADETNIVWLAPHTMSNARIGLANERYSVELYAQNIFKNMVPQSIARTTEQIAGRPTLSVTPPLKRTIGMRVSYKF